MRALGLLLALIACHPSNPPPATTATTDVDTTDPALPTAVARPPYDSAAVFPHGHPDASKFLEPSRASVLGLEIGSADTTVLRVLGAPSDSTPPTENEMLNAPLRIWRWAGIEVQFEGTRLFDLSCVASRCVTADHITIGSTRTMVQSTYGPGFEGHSADSDILRYYGRPGQDCWLQFGFEQDKVAEIALACDNS